MSDRARLELAAILDEWVRDSLEAQAHGDPVTAQALQRAVRDLAAWRTKHVTA